MNKLISQAFTLGAIALITFVIPITQLVPVAAAQSPVSASFVKDQVTVTEGTTAYLRVKLDQPVTATTKVTVEFDPEDGTTKSDVRFRDAVTLTYRAGGITTKSIALRTIRTSTEGNKGLVATITKVNNIEVDGDSAEVTVLDQNPTVAGLRNTNPPVNLPSPTNNTPTTCFDLTTDLSTADKGDKPEPVRKLQTFLYPKYLNEPATGYFGALTKAAVIKFQTDFGISPAEGFVGPKTRDKIKELSCGQKSASTVPTYNPNTAWWLNPTPTPTTPVPTPTATSTIPTDCSKYAGVIPGETRKLSVEQRSMWTSVYKPSSAYGSISPEGLRDLQLMYGDVGYTIQLSDRNPSRESFSAGTVYAYKFKTTEYNYAPYYDVATFPNPATRVGVIGMSVSECPGDFTSPKVLEQKSGYDVTNLNGDGKFRDCVIYNTSYSTQIGFGVPVAPTLDTGCNLEPNKTYYLNITTGFFNEEEGGKYPYITDEGHTEGAGSGTGMVVDIRVRPLGAGAAATQIYGNVPDVHAEMIKNRSAAYSEYAKFYRMFEEFRRAGEQRRQACVATLPASDLPGASSVGGQYSAGWSRCSMFNKVPLLPFYLP